MVSNDKLVLEIEDLAVLARDLRRHADSLESELTRLGLMWKTVDRHGWEHRAELTEHRFKRMKKDLQHSVDGLRSHANEVERRIGALDPGTATGPAAGARRSVPPDGSGTPDDTARTGGPGRGSGRGSGSSDPNDGGNQGGQPANPGLPAYPTYPSDPQGGTTDPQATPNGSTPSGQGDPSQSINETLDSLKAEHQAVVDGLAQIKQDTVDAVNNALGGWTQQHSAELGGMAGMGGAALGGVMGTTAQGLSSDGEDGETLRIAQRDDGSGDIATDGRADASGTPSSNGVSHETAALASTPEDGSARRPERDE